MTSSKKARGGGRRGAIVARECSEHSCLSGLHVLLLLNSRLLVATYEERAAGGQEDPCRSSPHHRGPRMGLEGLCAASAPGPAQERSSPQGPSSVSPPPPFPPLYFHPY